MKLFMQQKSLDITVQAESMIYLAEKLPDVN
jgi:hypothetical protein